MIAAIANSEQTDVFVTAQDQLLELQGLLLSENVRQRLSYVLATRGDIAWHGGDIDAAITFHVDALATSPEDLNESRPALANLYLLKYDQAESKADRLNYMFHSWMNNPFHFGVGVVSRDTAQCFFEAGDAIMGNDRELAVSFWTYGYRSN